MGPRAGSPIQSRTAACGISPAQRWLPWSRPGITCITISRRYSWRTCAGFWRSRDGRRSVRGALHEPDLVAHVVLARGLVHRDAFDLLKGLAVEYQQRAVFVPDTQQQVAAIAGEFDMGGILARYRAQGMGHFQGLLVDQVDGIVVRAEEHIGPGVGRVLMAAHEEAGAFG